MCGTWGILHLLWTVCLVIAGQNFQYIEAILPFKTGDKTKEQGQNKIKVFFTLNVSLLPILYLPSPLPCHWTDQFSTDTMSLSVSHRRQTVSSSELSPRYFPTVADNRDWQSQCEWSEQIPTEKENAAFPSLKHKTNDFYHLAIHNW